MNLNIKDMYINYEKSGTGPDVILMHGWGQNVKMMFNITEALNDQYTCYNIDLPGFGESDEPEFAYTISDYVSFLEEFIIINNIQNPIIIGHSFGCRIAIKYSVNNDVKAMVLTGAAGVMPKRGLNYYSKVYTYKLFKNFKDTPFIKHYVREMMDNSGSDDYRNSSPVLKGILRNTVNEDLTQYLGLIDEPVLLVFGSDDDATPLWMGKVMEKEMRNAQLIIYNKASHYAYIEQSERFNNDIKTFLEGIR